MKSGSSRTNTSHFVFIDVNQLFFNIVEKLNKKGIQFPIETYCSLAILGGNDFVSGYCQGIGYDFYYKTLLKHSKRFSKMIVRHDGVKINTDMLGNFCTIRYVHIDLELFKEFTKFIYMEKYKLGSFEEVLEKKGLGKIPILDSNKMEVFARNVMHNLIYWLNTGYLRYHNKDKYISFPCDSQENGISVWGYKREPNKNFGRNIIVQANNIYKDIKIKVDKDFEEELKNYNENKNEEGSFLDMVDE